MADKHMSLPDDNGTMLVPVARIYLGFTGPAAHHNLICWLCNERPAVYDMNPNWVFRPCWACQAEIAPPRKWWEFWKRKEPTHDPE